VLLLVLSGFFSGSETALTAASRGKLRTQADKGSRGAQRALDITEDNERLIGSVLLGNNLVNILATSLATALFTRAFGDQCGTRRRACLAAYSIGGDGVLADRDSSALFRARCSAHFRGSNRP